MMSEEKDTLKKLRQSYSIKKIGSIKILITIALKEDSHNYANSRSSSRCTTTKTKSIGFILKNFKKFCPLPYFPIYWFWRKY